MVKIWPLTSRYKHSVFLSEKRTKRIVRNLTKNTKILRKFDFFKLEKKFSTKIYTPFCTSLVEIHDKLILNIFLGFDKVFNTLFDKNINTRIQNKSDHKQITTGEGKELALRTPDHILVGVLAIVANNSIKL